MRLTILLTGGAALGIAVAISAPAFAADDKHHSAVDVTADPEQRSDDVVVVGKSYGQEVGKTVTPLKDVANTVTVIDRAQIEAQNLFTLEDALTATVGVTVNGVSSEDPSFFSRGFAINNYLVDGVPTLAFGFPGVVPDLFAYDRLEVLRGPAGLFSGTGNPAGSINLVRKRPLDIFTVRAAAGYGSWDNTRFELDVSTPLGQRAGIRGGLMVQDQDQFFDVGHRNRLNAFAVADIELGADTTFTFGGSYDRFRPAIQSGLPGYVGGATDGSEGRLLDVDRSTYLGADWNRFRSDTYTGFAELTHRISNRWTLRATGLYNKVDRIDIYSYIGNQPVTPANAGKTNHIAFRGDSFSETRSVDVNAIGSFRAFGQDQTLILGADYQAQDFDSYSTRLSNYARINVFNPVSPAEPPLNPYAPSPLYPVQGSGATCAGVTAPTATCVAQTYGATNTVVEQYGLYGQARIQPVAGMTLIGGGRLTWWEQAATTLLPVRGPQRATTIDAQFTPYAGLVWDVTRDLNLYASYADSFAPQSTPAGRTLFGGGEVKPLVGDQYEIGSKLALMDDRLLLTGAVYQITQSNRNFNVADDPLLFLQVGKVRARGIEAAAQGEIRPGWFVNGGYTYTKTKYLEDTQPQFEGLALTPIIPEHMVKLFTNYAPKSGMLDGASLGGGVTWFSETFGGTPSVVNANGTRTVSSIVRQPAYAVVDLRAGYAFTDLISLAVNMNNLFDKNYYSRISSTGRGNYYGAPRSVFATLRVGFR